MSVRRELPHAILAQIENVADECGHSFAWTAARMLCSLAAMRAAQLATIGALPLLEFTADSHAEAYELVYRQSLAAIKFHTGKAERDKDDPEPH